MIRMVRGNIREICIVIFLLLIIPQFVNSQIYNDSINPPFILPDHMPQMKGDDDEILKFIYDNLQYPQEAVDKRLQGKVVVRFIVDAGGTVVEPEIYEGLGRELDAEALRLVGLLPKFDPAVKNGNPVSCYIYWPVLFRLREQ